MEALIVFLSELILVLLIAGIIFSVVTLLTMIMGAINFGVNTKVRTEKVNWLRRLSIIFAIVFVIILALTLVINFFLFEPSARWVLDQVKTRTGIEVTFESAKGNIFSGEVHLQGAKLKRENHPKSCFDLQAEEIALDMDMIALITWRTRMEELQIIGLKGTFQRVGKVNRLKPRRAFEFKNFILEDVDIEISDTTRGEKPIVIPIKIEKMQSTPFRSQLSIFDILFNSTGKGTLAEGSQFTILKKESQDSRESWWTFNDLPLELIGAYVGGPFRFISAGGIFLEVKSQWEPGEKPAINMNCHLVLRDIKAEVPETYPETGLKRKMADRMVAFINDHSKEFSFHFSFRISEETFKDVVSLEGAGFWKLFREKLTRGLVQLAGKTKEKIKEIGKKGIEKFKDFLDKRRKKKN